MSIVYANQAKTLLELDLPPVALLRGSDAERLWTLATAVADFHQIHPADRFVVDRGLTTSAVRDLIRWAGFAPNGPVKLAQINLHGATHSAYHALLKLLEEPPEPVRFLLTAAFGLPTVLVSRCRVYTVITGAGDEPPAPATRDTVLALVRSIANRDTAEFEKAVAHTDREVRDLLYLWLGEALSGNRNLFTDEDMHQLHRDRHMLLLILRRLSAAPAAHARLAVRVALEPFLTR